MEKGSLPSLLGSTLAPELMPRVFFQWEHYDWVGCGCGTLSVTAAAWASFASAGRGLSL
jgi:hypothetical protein